MTTGERIRQERRAAGLTQEELATRLGIQGSAVAKYESGRVSNIKRSTLKKMANIFGCSPAYIMGFTDERNRGKESPFLGEIIREYRENHNMSVSEFAERSGIRKDYIELLENKWDQETGDRVEPSSKCIRLAAKAMGLSDEELFKKLEVYIFSSKGKEISWKKIERSTLASTSVEELEKRKLLDYYGRLNEAGQQEAIKRIEELTQIPKYTQQDDSDPGSGYIKFEDSQPVPSPGLRAAHNDHADDPEELEKMKRDLDWLAKQ